MGNKLDLEKVLKKLDNDVSKLRKCSGMNRRKFADYFGIPYRTVEAWETEQNHCVDYLFNLMAEKMYNEDLLNLSLLKGKKDR